MKKIIVGLFFALNIIILASCQVDKCPQHGERTVPAQQQPHRV